MDSSDDDRAPNQVPDLLANVDVKTPLNENDVIPSIKHYPQKTQDTKHSKKNKRKHKNKRKVLNKLYFFIQLVILSFIFNRRIKNEKYQWMMTKLLSKKKVRNTKRNITNKKKIKTEKRQATPK